MYPMRNMNMAESISCQIQKMSESESRQNMNLLEFENVLIFKNREMSKFSKNGKCQNPSKPEIIRI